MRGLSSHFVWTNRSKESLTLDVKAPGAAPVMEGLLARADVLVQNLAPGAAARLGLDYETLSARYPRLIVCDISGYGGDGPYRDKKAYDLLVQSESGFVSVTGTAEEGVKAGASVADIAAGMYAYSNILAALIERGQTGRGKRIDVSMLESMVEWMSFPMYYAFDGAEPPPRARRRPRHHLPLRAVPDRRRQDRDARAAERAGVVGLLQDRAGRAGAGHACRVRHQLACAAPIGPSCGRGSSRRSRT